MRTSALALVWPSEHIVQQIAKDPYVFDVLALTDEAAECDMEQSLMERIVETPRELDAGFAVVSRYVYVDVGGDDFSLDVLFFHVVQLRYVVVDKLRFATHNPTVGIRICGSHNDNTVRYVLGQTDAPAFTASVFGHLVDELIESHKLVASGVSQLTRHP
ncbi:PDDEXK nuclease domain-containing protein [Cryobacterium sp. CG_9.6]|uniref:PDDEXK nuclease domain-containing protein n=1 Tax=Cryobacterium sp. CG_9.6 TaxID=2760710 RepID=UPI00247412DC|nr:PDDEXK nuclease domain-containing protein [Cryobacterium sp. CG_9.6]MDH6236559.1 hypothetical protein [Cryobacterium sp. CG_9.6]